MPSHAMESGRQLKLIIEKKDRGRKVTRPISIRGWNHVVMKSRYYVLRRNHALVRRLVRETQDRFGMRIRALSVMENHVHVMMRAPTREHFANAMRFLCGGLGRKLCLKLKIKPKRVKGDAGTFFSQRIWSRIVKLGSDLATAEIYIWRNPFKAGIFARIDCMWIRGGLLQLDSG
ncbi:MAG: transposase [Deltaproteobacteria bacterium]|nr:transposase [Deltaproteobacteria bacterium]